MRTRSLSLLLAFCTLTATAQYGTFDANAVKDATTTTTLVVLDAGDSPYNRAMMDAVKAHWTFTKSVDFITVNDLATQPLGADKTYLVKTLRNDPEKFTGTFLTLMRGWKQKKGEVLEVTDNAIVNLPPSQDVAFLQIDPAGMATHGTSAFLNLYLKAIQDYLSRCPPARSPTRPRPTGCMPAATGCCATSSTCGSPRSIWTRACPMPPP